MNANSRLWLLLLCLSASVANAQTGAEKLQLDLKPLLAVATARQQEVSMLLGQMDGLMDVDGLATLSSERLGDITALCPRARAALAQAEVALTAVDRGAETLIAKSGAAAQTGFATTADLRQTTVEVRQMRAKLVDESCQLAEQLGAGGWEVQADGSLSFASESTAELWNALTAQRNATAEKHNLLAVKWRELRAAGAGQ